MKSEPQNPQTPHDSKTHVSPDTPTDHDSIFGYEIPAPLQAALNLLRSVFNNSAKLHTQYERWLPVLTALRQLGHTSQKLGLHYFHFFTHDADEKPTVTNDADSKTPDRSNTRSPDALPIDLLTELHAGFTELTQTFPDVASFFLDTDKIDKFLADILLDPTNALPGHHLFKLINEQSTRAIGKFVEIAILTAGKDTPSAETTHAFLQRAEQLLDSIVQRWIWPIVDPTDSPNPINSHDEHTP